MLVIISPFENEFTGRGTRYPDLAKLATEKNIELTVLTSNFNHSTKQFIEYEKLSDYYKVIKISSYKGHYSLSRIVAHWNFALKSALFIIRKRSKISGVIVSSIPPEIFFLVSLSVKRDCKVTLDVRDIWPDALPERATRLSVVKILFSFYCRFLYSSSAFLTNLTISSVAKSFYPWIKEYIRYDINEIRFIPLGYDPSRWDQDSLKTLSYPQLTVRKFVYIGGLTPQFDLRHFSSFLKDGDELLVIGDGPLSKVYKSAFPKAVFTGVLSPKAAAYLLYNCQFGLLPITGKAYLPNKVFDFIAIGKSVITMKNTEAYKLLSKYVKTIDYKNLDEMDLSNTPKYKNYNPPKELSKSNLSIKLLETIL
jgi:hypothetical protein